MRLIILFIVSALTYPVSAFANSEMTPADFEDVCSITKDISTEIVFSTYRPLLRAELYLNYCDEKVLAAQVREKHSIALKGFFTAANRAVATTDSTELNSSRAYLIPQISDRF